MLHSRSSHTLRISIRLLLLSWCCLLSVVIAQTQDPPQKDRKTDPLRNEAFDLFEEGKMVDAMPLLEKLSAEHPEDNVILERLGVATLNVSQTQTDPELRKKARIRARAILVKSQQLGNNSNLTRVLLGMIPEDGSETPFSGRKEVEETMRQAESDFARGDLDKARQGYVQAILLDPNLYDAALFAGDVFFRQHKPGFAGEWFARAIQIDPDRETAYRYWGDTLKAEGKMEEARAKFIEAVIADPYGNRSWVGLTQWADSNQVKLNYLRLQDKASVKVEDSKNTTITLDANLGKKDDLSGAAWLMYTLNRALWQNEKFKKEFPSETKYRRSLREETEGLHGMVSVLEGQNKKKLENLDPQLVELVKIDSAGFLEPFALLNRADDGIAQDYVEYRKANREKIRRYLDEYIVPKTPSPPR